MINKLTLVIFVLLFFTNTSFPEQVKPITILSNSEDISNNFIHLKPQNTTTSSATKNNSVSENYNILTKPKSKNKYRKSRRKNKYTKPKSKSKSKSININNHINNQLNKNNIKNIEKILNIHKYDKTQSQSRDEEKINHFSPLPIPKPAEDKGKTW